MGLLVETNLDCSFEILEDVHGKPLRIGGEMQLADKKNANGRIYSEELWRKSLAREKTAHRLRERRMVGELDHPASGKTAVERISHVMTSLDLRESKRFPGIMAVYGVYECIPTPHGKILETLHRNKIGVAVSSRGDGDLEDRGGESYVIPESYELDTFDAVMDPSVNVQVGVLESMARKEHTSTCNLKRVLGAAAQENLIKAIYGIVESGDFSTEYAEYYKSILEQVHPDDSEAYLMAEDALKELKNHLEVTKVKTTTPAVTESSAPSASGLTEQQVQATMNENAELKTKVVELEKRASAGQRLCQELLLTARAQKMQLESTTAKLRTAEAKASKYESAKNLIRKLREMVESLQHEGKSRIAAEKLLGALLQRINEAKVSSYVSLMLKNENVDVQKRLRPVLSECKTKTDVNKLLIAFRGSLQERKTTGRYLPPLNENGRRAARIPKGDQSPLLEGVDESGQNENQQGSEALTPQLQEQVNFTKRLLRASHGEPQQLNG